jgi:hypothetical protein
VSGSARLRFEVVFDDEPGVMLTDDDLAALRGGVGCGGVRVPVAGTIDGAPFRKAVEQLRTKA